MGHGPLVHSTGRKWALVHGTLGLQQMREHQKLVLPISIVTTRVFADCQKTTPPTPAEQAL
eukprot:3779382-Amphidinium_carterae.1